MRKPTYAATMDWMNYHHLLYFWTAVREGSVSRAAKKLRLARTTVTGQIRVLEESFGERLFERQGRRLALTEMGRIVFGYCEEIFALGNELLETVRGRPSGRPTHLVVGIAENVPKLVAKEILDPALRLAPRVHLVCREDRADRLVAELANHALDVVLTDAPLAPGSGIRAYSHPLGECGVTFLAAPRLAARLRGKFPASLDGAPVLLPTRSTQVRRALDYWFEENEIRPDVHAEFDDSALLKEFGRDGRGAFPAASAIETRVMRQYGVKVVGRLPQIREKFYAISAERRIKNPAVAAICNSARAQIFRKRVSADGEPSIKR